MNERDQILIVDLIGHRLSSAEEQAAYARIDSEPQLRAEYEAQLAALAAAAATSPPLMTPDERTTLRASLRAQLHLAEDPAAVVPPPAAHRRWWAPITALAAAAAVVLGAVVILPNALSGDDADSALTFAAEQATESTAQASIPAAGQANTGESDERGDGGASAETESPAAAEAPAEASDDTHASGEEAPEAMEEALVSLPYLATFDLAEMERSFGEDPGSFDEELQRTSSDDRIVDSSHIASCVATHASGAAESDVLAAVNVDGREAAVALVTPADGDRYLLVIAIDDCGVLATTQP